MRSEAGALQLQSNCDTQLIMILGIVNHERIWGNRDIVPLPLILNLSTRRMWKVSFKAQSALESSEKEAG